ncbi:hypothetical protein TSAR_015064, partial [Trichomalopsis sarcophagae]
IAIYSPFPMLFFEITTSAMVRKFTTRCLVGIVQMPIRLVKVLHAKYTQEVQAHAVTRACGGEALDEIGQRFRLQDSAEAPANFRLAHPQAFASIKDIPISSIYVNLNRSESMKTKPCLSSSLLAFVSLGVGVAEANSISEL